MDRKEAAEILTEQLRAWRARPYEELASLVEGEATTMECVGASGVRYQLEIQVFWDDASHANVRIRGAIDDGGLRAFFPLVDDFIMAPDGRFIGEDSG